MPDRNQLSEVSIHLAAETGLRAISTPSVFAEIIVSIHLAAETGLRDQPLVLKYPKLTEGFNPPCGGDGFKRLKNKKL